jgi:hypothetical protein
MQRWKVFSDVVGDGDFESTAAERYLQALQVLEGLRDRHSSVVQWVSTETQKVDTAEGESEKANEEFQLLLDGFEECPLCGSAIQHEH